MRGNEFLNKMELIDPAYVEAADAAPERKKKRWTLWRAAVAACVCLVVLAGTAAAVSGRSGTWLVAFFSGKDDKSGYGETGYELGANIEKFPISELSENLQRVSERIVHQFETTTVFSSWAPGHWQEKNFSAEEAWAFIGLESLQKPDWDLEEWYNTLNIYGDSTGRIEHILIDTAYQVGDIHLQAWAEIYTENFNGEVQIHAVTEKDISFTETFRSTPGGNRCQIISSSANERGYLVLEGYLVANGVLYQLHLAYQEQDAAQAEELLYQWADMF